MNLKINLKVLLIAFSILSPRTLCSIENLGNPSGEECYSDDSHYFCVESNEKNVNQETLVFVTPWNRIGYNLVVNNAHKTDMVSPVWFYLEKNKATGVYEFQGRQDINKTLIDNLRNRNSNIKILPRFYVSGMEDEFRWFIRPVFYGKIIEELVSIAKELGLDGYVIDIPLLNRIKYTGAVKKFLLAINTEMAHLFKVVTFAGYRISVTKNLDEIRPYLDIFERILVCTYDFPNKTFDRWLAPLNWVDENIQFYSHVADSLNVNSKRFMIGMPFYGYMIDTNTYNSKQIQIEE